MKVIKKIILLVVIIVIGALYAYGSWSKPIYDTNVGSGSYIMTEQIKDAMNLKQQFVCPNNGLDVITIKIALQENEKIGNYNWEIEDVNTKKIVGSGNIEQQKIDKKGIASLSFDKIKDSKDKTYQLTIMSNGVKEDSIALYMTTPGNYARELLVNGESVEQSIVLKMKMMRFNIETFIVFVGLILYMVLFIRFMNRLFK